MLFAMSKLSGYPKRSSDLLYQNSSSSGDVSASQGVSVSQVNSWSSQSGVAVTEPICSSVPSAGSSVFGRSALCSLTLLSVTP